MPLQKTAFAFFIMRRPCIIFVDVIFVLPTETQTLNLSVI